MAVGGGDEKARFFDGVRPQFYFHSARLKKDNKTGDIFWHLNLVITCVPEEIARCNDIICSNYAAIETRDNRVTSLEIDLFVMDQAIAFYQLKENKSPSIKISPCDLEDLKFTRNEKVTELWAMLVVRATDQVWDFVRRAAFTRLWVEFKPAKSPFVLQ